LFRVSDADESTGSALGVRIQGNAADDATDAGLVLLFAADYRSLPSVIPIGAEPVVIGRSRPANVVIPQAAISRMHARVARTTGGFVVRDLGSRNGVIVEGARVDEAVLEVNDVLRIGDALFKFVPIGAHAYAPYRIDGSSAPDARQVTIAGAVGGMQMARVSAEVNNVAPTEIPILVTGETGTGKELVARAIHAASGRRGRFAALNCAAIPQNLVESELFGFRKGAFSGAVRDHPGVFRAAAGGTLLLDEIGDMPLEAQAKLLRTLETREVVPLGGVLAEHADVRIVAATHRDLRAYVDAGTFRGDLYARLNGYTIVLPPLRHRKEDLYVLVRRILGDADAIEREATFPLMVALCNYHWPYNVRELVSAVKRALSVGEGRALDPADLPEALTEAMADYGKTRDKGAVVARKTTRPTGGELAALLREHHGNVAAVARALGKDRAQVHRWMQQLGIDPNLFR
jgi:transcriptional regulator with GAF, ATPase, and Fis domain